MQYLQEDSQSGYVTALFADRALSFALQKGATLEDLAHRLIFLDGREPLAVIINLGSAVAGPSKVVRQTKPRAH
jgi:hypothetical protein